LFPYAAYVVGVPIFSTSFVLLPGVGKAFTLLCVAADGL
jgi:hypothetical protein